MKVLVADDEAMSRAVVTALLQKAGYQTVTVPDGDAALAALTVQDAPLLAVLDWVMPGRSGLEVCRALRTERRERYTYLVLLTAHGSRAERLQGMDAGADDFLTKPIDEAELLARLHSGERVLSLERSLAERITELQAALDQVKHLEGIITICMHCKRIASGPDEWQRVEAYLAAHSGASFTHGLCKDCLDKHFPTEGEPDLGDV